MGETFTQAGDFLIRVLFQLYMVAVLLRLMLQMVRADYYNPIVQFLVTVTNPPLKPLRRLIPGFLGIDCASVALLFLLGYLKFILLYVLVYQFIPNFIGMIVLVFADLLKLIFWVYFFAIILQAISSWIAPNQYNPITIILRQLTEPLVRPIRKRLPMIGGIDLSPLVVLILLQLINITLLQILLRFANLLTIGMR